MRLGVNIDHIASVRQLRKGKWPSVTEAARICEKAGADSIVAHLREDRRHINDADVAALKKTIRTKFNLEMSVAEDILRAACRIKPDQATLVPEKRKELTTEGGLDLIKNFKRVKRTVRLLEDKGISVSLFIDPDKKQILAAKKTGAKSIEIHTGRYAEASDKKNMIRSINEISAAAKYARSIGLRVFAGHGLDYTNIARLKKITEIEEYNIGYSIICRALFDGLGNSVRLMKRLVR